jgi:hypothetical protein
MNDTILREPISQMLWEQRYRLAEDGHAVEPSIEASWERVALALAAAEAHDRDGWRRRFLDVLAGFRFLPAGRILANAGSARRQTLLNCFASGTLHDSVGGIFGVLRRFDLVVGAIHGGFGLARECQTTRILRALDRPVFHLLAHPLGRLLSGRAEIEVDIERVLRHARARGCALEVNAQPDRLDLDDVWCRTAAEHGTLLAIDSDAHSRYDFADLDFGLTQARRGWVEPGQVVNTWPLARLCKWLRACRR